jgi:hypothetical protein
MPLTIPSPYVYSRVDSDTLTISNPAYAGVDDNICQNRLYPPVRDLGFGLCSVTNPLKLKYLVLKVI